MYFFHSHTPNVIKNSKWNIKNLKKFKIFNFSTFFWLCILTLSPAFFLLKSYFQELILSKDKLPYNIQFLTKSQLEIAIKNSTIDFFWHAKLPKCYRPYLQQKPHHCVMLKLMKETSALRATSRHRVNCQPSYRCRALSAEVHVIPPCWIKFWFSQ